MDPCELPLDASLFRITDQMIFFLLWSFPISVAMRSSFLNCVLWNSKEVLFNETSIGHCFIQEMSTCAIDDVFTPV